MRNSTHELLGATAAVGLSLAVSAEPAELVGVTLASIWGSWLPDADTEGSRIHRVNSAEKSYPALRLVGALLRLVPSVIVRLTGHREATHCVIALLGIPPAQLAVIGFFLLPPPVAGIAWAGLACGYAIHLLADGCTQDGVPLWRPFSERKVHFLPRGLRFRTLRPIHPAEQALAVMTSLLLAFELYLYVVTAYDA